MGEVYRARDTRLDRDVAIKLLPEHLSDSPERRQRLAREARAISSLQHPNICALHDLGSENGVDFLVMEYLDGETLAERLSRGALPLRELLAIAVAIADALDKAHRKGLIHRDLSPGNIMLTRSGPKLLDFGLAKRIAVGLERTEATSEVSTKPLTAEGKLVGTFRYMSPEQVEGKEADARSDVFAFGAVLYEMATGKRAFDGSSLASVIAAVLERDPVPIHELQPAAPAALDRIVDTCLAKDPDERFQSAHDLKLQLEWMREGGTLTGAQRAVAPPRSTRELVAWVLASAGVLASLGLGIAWLIREEPERRVLRAEVLPAPATFVTMRPGRAGPATLSRDGRHLAWTAIDEQGNTALWVRALDRAMPRRLEGTSGAEFPFWSPDGRSLGFFAGGKLKRIDASGQSTLTICDVQSGRGGTWNQHGVILFGDDTGSGIHRVDAKGGEPAPVTVLDRARQEVTHRFPRFLPDGEHFLFLNRAGSRDAPARDSSIWLGSLSGDAPRRITEAGSQAEYAEGYLLFARDASLMAQPFDLRRLELHGEALPVVEGVLAVPLQGSAAFSVSQHGSLAYQADTGGNLVELAWYNREGAPIDSLSDGGAFSGLALAPDQSRAVVAVEDVQGGDANLWIFDLGTGIRRRLTSHPGPDRHPVWSHDSRRVFYTSRRESRSGIYVKEVEGIGDEVLVSQGSREQVALSPSPDGRFLAIASILTNQADLMLLALEGAREPEPLVVTEFDEFAARFSPDGRWLAYTSDESSDSQVYVLPFPGLDQRWQVSVEGGWGPRWRGDGRELFFLSHDSTVMSATVDGRGSSFVVQRVRPLFEIPRLPAPDDLLYDVTSDGERFLISAVAATAREPIVLVFDWTAELHDR
jgi:Tol biopolymer transport system component